MSAPAPSQRRLAALAAGLALSMVAGAPAAWAQVTPAGPATPEAGSSLSDQAASLAAQIQQQGRLADQLSEQADRAQIRVDQIAGQLRVVQATLDATSAELARATFTLAHQAVAAYTQGGRQPLTYVAHDTADDRALIDGYASAVAGIQQRDVDAYRSLRQRQTDQAQALAVAHSSAVASVEQLRAAQQAAQAMAAQEQRTLDAIDAQPRLTTLVASAETSQYQAAAPAVQARFTAARPGTTTAPRSSSAPATGATSTAGTAGTGTVPAHPRRASPVAVPSRYPSSGAGAVPVNQAPVTATAAPPVTPTAPPAPSGVSAAIAYAYAQIGKAYQWGGAGPDSFDCSGLVMRAYEAAGITFDHSAQDQYDATARVAIGALQPGDLVFFGTAGNVYHVGIYVGGGGMVDAPHAGASVRVEGIYWGDLLAGGRV